LNNSRNSTSKPRGIYVGMKTNHMKTITEADIVLFAGVSGDFNPVHMCEEYAKKTLFNSRIAHGMLALALISAALDKLPGLVVYLSQTANFLKPIRIGDSITARIEVIEKDDTKGILCVRTNCINQNNEMVVEGEAKIRIYEPPGD
jgi:3-hydroxybutyryl-CoA dehydratase